MLHCGDCLCIVVNKYYNTIINFRRIKCARHLVLRTPGHQVLLAPVLVLKCLDSLDRVPMCQMDTSKTLNPVPMCADICISANFLMQKWRTL